MLESQLLGLQGGAADTGLARLSLIGVQGGCCDTVRS